MTTAMEVDESNKNVMASSNAVGSVSLSLHPLVLMNISEHWTRIRAQEGSAQQGISMYTYFFKISLLYNSLFFKIWTSLFQLLEL